MIRNIAAELGLTIRCAFLSVAAVTLFVLAIAWKTPELYGIALVLAFAAGTLWDREIRCDDCGISLETEDAAS